MVFTYLSQIAIIPSFGDFLKHLPLKERVDWLYLSSEPLGRSRLVELKVSLDLHITVGWVERRETQRVLDFVNDRLTFKTVATILCALKENWY